VTKPTPYAAFGELLVEGIKQTSLARRESLQQTHQFIADDLGYGVTTLYVWRRGEHLPDNPETVANLARIFAVAWQPDAAWITRFLELGEYGPAEAVEQLNAELFGDLLPVVSSPTPPVQPQPTPTRSRAGHPVVLAGLNFLAAIAFRLLEILPDSLSSGFLERISRTSPHDASPEINLFPITCGDHGLNLAEQRLMVSTAFGAYFTGLLEREQSYINLQGQIEVQAASRRNGLAPLQSLYWALQQPRGPRLVLIAAEGGMGKSTLAARLVRCLFEEEAVDMILGDSAKAEQVDPASGVIAPLAPGYDDPTSFFNRLYDQLGLPAEDGPVRSGLAVRLIRDRLAGRRAVIVVDNLESVSRGMTLLRTLRQLVSRDTRIIVTTRTTSGLEQQSDLLLVHLNPLRQPEHARAFLQWHISRYAAAQPGLQALLPDLADNRRLRTLIERTGGIPLLMQLVVSDVARFSWRHLDHLPQLFGSELLDFLYRVRWDELGQLGTTGLQARLLLRFVSDEQYRGQAITLDRLYQWAADSEPAAPPQQALELLQERFLLVNHDITVGNFAVFPSLTEFLEQQEG
jgi:hypothetical protein